MSLPSAGDIKVFVLAKDFTQSMQFGPFTCDGDCYGAVCERFTPARRRATW